MLATWACAHIHEISDALERHRLQQEWSDDRDADRHEQKDGRRNREWAPHYASYETRRLCRIEVAGDTR
jgi:hypothetical protein